MSKVKERANPVREFKNDPMMRELHEMRLKHCEETKNMSIKERIKKIKAEARAFREGK